MMTGIGVLMSEYADDIVYEEFYKYDDIIGAYMSNLDTTSSALHLFLSINIPYSEQSYWWVLNI